MKTPDSLPTTPDGATLIELATRAAVLEGKPAAPQVPAKTERPVGNVAPTLDMARHIPNESDSQNCHVHTDATISFHSRRCAVFITTLHRITGAEEMIRPEF